MSGIKYDTGKRQWDLLPFDSVAKIVEVLEFGAKKYTARNWELGFAYSRIFNSLQRHLIAWFQGEDNDPETGLSHMAHAACNTLFLLTFISRKVGEDDRPCVNTSSVPLNIATIGDAGQPGVVGVKTSGPEDTFINIATHPLGLVVGARDAVSK